MKFTVPQLSVLQSAVSRERTKLGDIISSGNVTSSTDPTAKAEAMVKLGTEFATLTALDNTLTNEIADRLAAAAVKAEKRSQAAAV